MRLRRLPGGVELSVHNFGPVIDEQERWHIFEPYQRARLGESRSVGWGLGLALVKACAEAHGGEVSCRSSDVEGTTFAMFLPTQAVAAESRVAT